MYLREDDLHAVEQQLTEKTTTWPKQRPCQFWEPDQRRRVDNCLRPTRRCLHPSCSIPSLWIFHFRSITRSLILNFRWLADREIHGSNTCWVQIRPALLLYASDFVAFESVEKESVGFLTPFTTSLTNLPHIWPSTIVWYSASAPLSEISFRHFDPLQSPSHHDDPFSFAFLRHQVRSSKRIRRALRDWPRIHNWFTIDDKSCKFFQLSLRRRFQHKSAHPIHRESKVWRVTCRVSRTTCRAPVLSGSVDLHHLIVFSPHQRSPSRVARHWNLVHDLERPALVQLPSSTF